MTIEFAPAPEHAQSLVRKGLEKILERTTRPARLAGVALGDLTLAAPHRMYDLGVDEIVRGKGLDAAQQTGLRCLVVRNGEALASAELKAAPSGETTELSTLNFGPFVEGTAHALDVLDADAALKPNLYELRLLRVSAIYVMALWLKGANAPDIIVPIAPAPPELAAHRQYSVDDFLAIIRPLAERRAGERPNGMVP